MSSISRAREAAKKGKPASLPYKERSVQSISFKPDAHVVFCSKLSDQSSARLIKTLRHRRKLWLVGISSTMTTKQSTSVRGIAQIIDSLLGCWTQRMVIIAYQRRRCAGRRSLLGGIDRCIPRAYKARAGSSLPRAELRSSIWGAAATTTTTPLARPAPLARFGDRPTGEQLLLSSSASSASAAPRKERKLRTEVGWKSPRWKERR